MGVTMPKIEADDLLSAIDTEIEARLYLSDFEKNEYGYGYNCCGCSTPSDLMADIKKIIERLAAS